jgi:anti-sigma factor RsiW
MKQCRSEGELRSYLDGELPAEEIASVGVHVAECAVCAAAVEALAARAQRVSALLGELSGAGASACLPVQRSRRWIATAAALAACLALAFVLLPKRTAQPVRPAPVAAGPPAVAAIPVPAVVQPSHPARPRKRPQSRKPEVQYFLALDDEPFEMGVVRRVALGPEEVLADVVFSPDGRARAIRLVNDSGN